MGRDAVEYGRARKFAREAHQLERSIGITTLSCIDRQSPSHYDAVMGIGSSPAERKAEALAQRPVALMKWAFDDYIVREVLTEATVTPSTPTTNYVTSSSSTSASAETSPPATRFSLLVPIVSEGVPDDLIAKHLRSHIESCSRGRAPPLHFLTPIDFVSCSERHVWVRSEAPVVQHAFSKPHLLRTPSGPVYTKPALRCVVSSTEEVFPLHMLPRLEYTVLLRNIGGRLGDVLPKLRRIRDDGFLNYNHVARHGVSAFRSYEAAQALLQRDYCAFLCSYLRGLSEGTPHVQREMESLLTTLRDPRSSSADWKRLLEGMRYCTGADRYITARAQTGIYGPHHELLLDFVERAASLAPRSHDSALLIREAVSRNVVLEKMQCLSEVYFNALASIRWDACGGGRVSAGDVVTCVTPRADAPRDVFHGAADHVNGWMTSDAHQVWPRLADPGQPGGTTTTSPLFTAGDVRVVRTAAEARECSIEDVVVPVYGRNAHAIFGQDTGAENEALLPLPENKVGALFHKLAAELQLTGCEAMRLAPSASYRHLVCRPDWAQFYLYDEARSWEWEENLSSSNVAVPTLKSRLYRDQEGIARLDSPLRQLSGKSVLARSGIRGADARAFFAKPARKAGMTCAIQMQLPHGTPITSALREVFQFASLQPSAICKLITPR